MLDTRDTIVHGPETVSWRIILDPLVRAAEGVLVAVRAAGLLLAARVGPAETRRLMRDVRQRLIDGGVPVRGSLQRVTASAASSRDRPA
jgi:hypothetical protein